MADPAADATVIAQALEDIAGANQDGSFSFSQNVRDLGQPATAQGLNDLAAKIRGGASLPQTVLALWPRPKQAFYDLAEAIRGGSVSLPPTVSALVEEIAEIGDSVEDIASYPLLISDLGPPTPRSGGGLGASTVGGTLQRTVDVALKQTLGRLPKFTDSKAFVAALDSSFAIKYEAGRSMVAWQPRSYLGQTELGGGVTGAQASVYARARNALSVVLPLIDGLYPLLPAADPQEVDAVRSIVKSQFQTLVDELGVEGGPRVQRVDELFDVLLKRQVGGSKGMVGYLAKVFGLNKQQVNTIDEEQNRSNFVLVRDYVRELKAAWSAFKTSGADLGIGLVLLSKALQVVAESVDEVYAAMDSVFVGEAERGVTAFPTGPAPSDTMLVSDLLSWIAGFATDEAPALVQESGRRGAGPIISTGKKLKDLTAELVKALESDSGLPAGLRHPRVRNPLKELGVYLGRVVQLATDIGKP